VQETEDAKSAKKVADQATKDAAKQRREENRKRELEAAQAASNKRPKVAEVLSLSILSLFHPPALALSLAWLSLSLYHPSSLSLSSASLPCVL
jgi:uncharacterized membrane protein